MSTNFPGSNDSFTEPSSPGSTALSSAGSGSRAHTKHHTDLGDAIEAMQAEATLLVHSHDGSTARHGSKLAQVNTHQSADTDSATSALHHTLGTGANQAASGTHTHTQATSHNSPDTDSATSSLHHTLGTGANQAAAGNHVHAHPLTIYYTSTGTFTKASFPGLYGVEVECIGAGGGSGGVAATDGTHFSFTTGGGGGAYAKAFILATDLLTSETVTVGVGGTAGAADTGGGSGGASSFGSHFGAGGGAGGSASGPFTTSAAGTNFGRGTSGSPTGTYDIGIKGEMGGSVSYISGAHFSEVSGLGGCASGGPYGGQHINDIGAYPTGFSSQAAQAGFAIGGGASGCAIGSSNGSPIPGAAGADGRVIVKLIY